MESLSPIAGTCSKGEPGETRPTGRQVSILVVDDDESICEVIGDILGTAGHRITKCLDGHSALKAIGRDQFDIVITDLGMPGMSGLELAELIHGLIPGLPIILVTALGSRFTDEDAVRGGVAAVLDKPFQFQELHDTVNRVLQLPA